MPKPQEIAVLVVNGLRFDDWDFVMVRRNWGDAFAYFQFSAAERDPIFNVPNTFPNWLKLQWKRRCCPCLIANTLSPKGC